MGPDQSDGTPAAEGGTGFARGCSDHQSSPARGRDVATALEVPVHGAPEATHARKVSFSSVDKGLPGGIWPSRVLRTSRLASALLGTRAGPLFPPFRAPS